MCAVSISLDDPYVGDVVGVYNTILLMMLMLMLMLMLLLRLPLG